MSSVMSHHPFEYVSYGYSDPVDISVLPYVLTMRQPFSNLIHAFFVSLVLGHFSLPLTIYMFFFWLICHAVLAEVCKAVWILRFFDKRRISVALVFHRTIRCAECHVISSEHNSPSLRSALAQQTRHIIGSFLNTQLSTVQSILSLSSHNSIAPRLLVYDFVMLCIS